MLHQIGTNHIFDDGTIFFCLLCKDSITENYPSDRNSAISQHFSSEDHERSARNLFKICVPDPKCESRNVKYLDIVNNSEFEVCEKGDGSSYVSKKDNHFVCLICHEEVSKVCREAEKIKHNLKCHLESELHVGNVKNSIWWTYHPKLDTNYIALKNIFMYCSFCQHVFESKENSLLEFAADHIETELNKNNASKVKLDVINSDSASKTEHEETNLNGVSKTEFEEKDSNIALSSQLEPDVKPKILKSGPMTDSTTTTSTQSKDISKNLKISKHDQLYSLKGAGSEINLNKVTEGLEGACKNLGFEDLDCSQVKKDLVCHTCLEQVEVFNEDVSFSMLKHAQKHKDFSLTYNNSEREIQMKACFECEFCHEQIEVFNNNRVLSYNLHVKNFHPDDRSSLVSIEDVSNDNNIKVQISREKFGLIAKFISLLPNGLRDHLNWVTLDEGSLYCSLCNCELSSTSDTNVACDILQNHFAELYHQDQYKLCEQLQTDIDHVEDGQELKEDNRLFKGLEFHRSEINIPENPNMMARNIEYKTNQKAQEVPIGKVRSRFEVLKVLNQIVFNLPIVDKNKHVLDEKEGHFLCKLCDETLRCTWSGSELVKHLTGESHVTKSIKSTSKLGKVRTHTEVLNILTELSNRNKLIYENIEHVRERNGRFFCKPCNEEIMCSLSGAKLLSHLKEPNHGLQLERMREKQSELKMKARQPEKVYKILRQLATYNREVSENIKIIVEKQGHFYCELCDEIILCTSSGRPLIDHLRNPQHYFQLSKL